MYRDPIIQKIIAFLDANGPKQLHKKYAQGDMVTPAKSRLPMCYIVRDTTEIRPASNMEDDHLMNMVANVVYDMTKDFNQSEVLASGSSSLYEIVEGRVKDGIALMPDTLMYQLGREQQIEEKLWIGVGSSLSVNYGLGMDRRGPGIFSVEALVRFTVRAHLPKPGLPINP